VNEVDPSLYDVTEGGNGYCDGETPGPCGEPSVNERLGNVDCQGTTACDAAPGFDGPSGVGAPKRLGAFKSDAATMLTQTTATLNARVNPNGQTVTECKFEYGTSTGYGSSIPCSTPPGSGSSPVAVSALLATGLTSNTEYHFRISANERRRHEQGRRRNVHDVLASAPSHALRARTRHGRTLPAQVDIAKSKVLRCANG
jgi:hypothetical protein